VQKILRSKSTESAIPNVCIAETKSRSQWPRGLRQERVFASLNTGVVDSNPTQGMDVFLRLFCVCVVLSRWLIPLKESYLLSVRLRKSKTDANVR
jgi:hypothetical protein